MTETASRQVILPAPDSYGSIVQELERVELEARERRLRAASEADRIRAAAHATAGEITASVPARVASALAELRARHVDAAEGEVAAIEARLDAAPAPSRRAPASPVAHAAVELLVAAVLGEPTPGSAADRTG